MARKLDAFEYGEWMPIDTNERVDPSRGLALYTEQGDYGLEVFSFIHGPLSFYIIEGFLYLDLGDQLFPLEPGPDGTSIHEFKGFQLIQNRKDRLVVLTQTDSAAIYYHLSQQSAEVVRPPDTQAADVPVIESIVRALREALLGK